MTRGHLVSSMFTTFGYSGYQSSDLWFIHYSAIIMGAMTSQITSLTIVYSTVIQAQITESTKAPRHRPLCGEFTGHRWIPRTNSQSRGKCFHLMTSPWWWSNLQQFNCLSNSLFRMKDPAVETSSFIWQMLSKRGGFRIPSIRICHVGVLFT